MYFRLAENKDVPEIVNLYKRGVESMLKAGIFQWDETYPSEEIITEDVAKSQLHLCICDGKIAAAFALNTEIEEDYKNASWENPDANFIAMHRLCVSPDFHRRGIGSACMTEIERFAKENGYESIWLDTFSGNHKALALYDKLGFKRVGEMFWSRGRFINFEKVL